MELFLDVKFGASSMISSMLEIHIIQAPGMLEITSLKWHQTQHSPQSFLGEVSSNVTSRGLFLTVIPAFFPKAAHVCPQTVRCSWIKKQRVEHIGIETQALWEGGQSSGWARWQRHFCIFARELCFTGIKVLWLDGNWLLAYSSSVTFCYLSLSQLTIISLRRLLFPFLKNSFWFQDK